MALGAEIVDLVGPDLLNDPTQIGGVGQVAVVQAKPDILLMWILVKVINARRIEGGRPPLQPMNEIAFREEQFGKVGAVLSGDTDDEGFPVSQSSTSILEGRTRVAGPAPTLDRRLPAHIVTFNFSDKKRGKN